MQSETKLVMIEEYAPSLSLNKGLRVEVYGTIEELEKDAGVPGRALALANKYLREKVALVDGRDKFVTELIKASGYAMKTEEVEKKDAEGKVTKVQVAAWTEVEYLKAFRKACLSGAIKGWSQVPAEIEAQLQAFADKLGAFKADAKKSERVGKPKVPPAYALEGADNIIKNATTGKWIATFKKEGIAHEDFATADAAANRVRLAWAIKAREDAKAKNVYV
jgi:hypothetical protein